MKYSEQQRVERCGTRFIALSIILACITTVGIVYETFLQDKRKTEPVHTMSGPIIKDVRCGPEPETFYEINGQKYFLEIDCKSIFPYYPDNHPQ